MTPVITMLAAIVLIVALFVVPPFWRLVRWEMAWDWRIAMFGWHTFLFGLALGAIGCFLLVAHWRVQIFGG
jgi:peptidoglycan/LPS O-acetylase OafA/YrhL